MIKTFIIYYKFINSSWYFFAIRNVIKSIAKFQINPTVNGEN